MARPKRPPVTERDLKGFKYFKLLLPLLDRLHAVGTDRDKAGNRQLFFDQYVAMLLLYFFNPIVVSLRGLQKATGLAKVQRLLGVGRTSLGSLSEASGVFAAEPLRALIQELAQQALPLQHGPEAEALRNLCAVDGTILTGLPRMVWALWQDDQHRAVKIHLHFDVLKSVPVDATLTPAACSEPAQLQAMLQPQRFYVLDRGYASYQLFHAILQAGSSLVARVQEYAAFGLVEDRPLTPEARAAGVVRDGVINRLGSFYALNTLRHPLRLVIVHRTKSDGTPENLWLVTDRLDLAPELVALAYRYRWTIELFFRWFKCVLGCQHLLALNANGIAIQVYVALIASLLIVLWTGRKPTRRTWEMIQFYLSGWATLEELEAHLLSPQPKSKS